MSLKIVRHLRLYVEEPLGVTMQSDKSGLSRQNVNQERKIGVKYYLFHAPVAAAAK